MINPFKKNNHEIEQKIRTITFSEALPNLILKGEKSTTWRIDEPVPIKRTSDTEGIKIGDKLSLRDNLQFEFAKAVVNGVNHTCMGNLKREDFDGHEKYSSRQEMYKQFENYYHIPINDNTKIVVIKFTISRDK